MKPVRYIALLALSGCAATTPYMPLAAGNSWHYRAVNLATGAENSITMRIEDRTERGFLVREPDGTPCWWRVEEGFLVLERPGEVIRFFQVPPRTGVSWWLKGADGRRYCVRVAGYQDVTVPAGTFPRALRVELESEDRTTRSVFHFARGAGIVRREQHGNGEWLLELLSYRLAR